MYLSDRMDLIRQLHGHQIYIVSQHLGRKISKPSPKNYSITHLLHPLHLGDECLPTQLENRPDFQTNPRNLVSKGARLRYHGIGIHLWVGYLALHIDSRRAFRGPPTGFWGWAHPVGRVGGQFLRVKLLLERNEERKDAHI
jgi:hypothetical protein